MCGLRRALARARVRSRVVEKERDQKLTEARTGKMPAAMQPHHPAATRPASTRSCLLRVTISAFYPHVRNVSLRPQQPMPTMFQAPSCTAVPRSIRPILMMQTIEDSIESCSHAPLSETTSSIVDISCFSFVAAFSETQSRFPWSTEFDGFCGLLCFKRLMAGIW